MKLKIYQLTLLLTLFIIGSINTPTVSGQKILIGDEWQYDDGTTIYNETSESTFQIETGSGAIATSVIRTDRITENDYVITKFMNGTTIRATLNLVMVEEANLIWVTQAGGFPIGSYATFTGQGSIYLELVGVGTTDIAQKDFDGIVADDSFSGNPALALTTAESQTFTISRQLGNLFTGENGLIFTRKYIISTNQAASDPIRNYTLTPISVSLNVRIQGVNFAMVKTPTQTEMSVDWGEISDRVILPPNMPQAQLYQYDSTNRLPILIRQTQAARLNPLSLNQVDDEGKEIVEYRLVQEDEVSSTSSIDGGSTGELSTTDDDPFLFGWAVIGLLIIAKKRR